MQCRFVPDALLVRCHRLGSNRIRQEATAGFVPEIVEKAAQPNAIMCMVASEVGVTLSDEAICHLDVDGVTLVPVRDISSDRGGTFVAAWLPETESPVLRALVDMIESAATLP